MEESVIEKIERSFSIEYDTKSKLNDLSLNARWRIFYGEMFDDGKLSVAAGGEGKGGGSDSAYYLASLESSDLFSQYVAFREGLEAFSFRAKLLREKKKWFSLYAFREHHRPVWEDEGNKDGGVLTVNCCKAQWDEGPPFRVFLWLIHSF